MTCAADRPGPERRAAVECRFADEAVLIPGLKFSGMESKRTSSPIQEPQDDSAAHGAARSDCSIYLFFVVLEKDFYIISKRNFML